MQLVNITRVALALSILFLAKFSVLPDIVNLLILWHWLEMDVEANSLLAVMRTRSLPEPQILELYSKLKADIKHRTVPESAISPLFELIRLALDSPNYLDAGLSMLTHLIKRLQGQLQDSILDAQAQRIIPILIERLGSVKDRHRARARQALMELYNVSGAIATMIVTLLGDVTLHSTDARAQEEAMQWILMMHKEKGIKVYKFVPRIIDCIKSSDRFLSKAAKACIIQLFRNADYHTKEIVKSDLHNGGVDQTMTADILYEIGFNSAQDNQRLKPMYPSPRQPSSRWPPPFFNGFSDSRNPSRQLSSNEHVSNVRHANQQLPGTQSALPRDHNTQLSQMDTESKIKPSTSSTTLNISHRPRPTARSVSHSTETSNSTVSHKPSESTNTTVSQPVVEPLPFLPAKSKAEQEAEKLDPIYVESARDLDNIFREMLPYFEGAETEQNWKRREQSVLKVRKITKGNAYDDYPTAYLACIKLLLNGLIGVAESLRTTQCTLGCHCIQDVARRTGSSLDPLVEILLQSFVKLCGQTKKITAANGDACVICIISNVSFNVRVAQHIYGATQDKNVSPRLFACDWLMTVLTKHGQHKSVMEHNGALDLVNKSITAGLMDKDASVRARMRPTYWAFARLWNDKSESILLSLDKKLQQLLLKDAANPFPDTSAVAAALGEKAAALSQSTSAVPTRPSIKETMARNRANRNLPAARPSSAGPTISPTRDTSTHVAAKPAIGGFATKRSLNTSTTGNLSSAPVRPNRMFRKPEIPRPATADPSSQRPKHDARSATPAARRPKTPVAPATVKKGILAAKKPVSQPASPTKTVQRRISWSDDLPGGSLESGPSGSIVDDEAIEDGPADDDTKPSAQVPDVSTHPVQEVAGSLPIPSTHSHVTETPDLVNDDVWLRISMSPRAMPTRSLPEAAASPPKSPTCSNADRVRDPDDGEMSSRISQSPRAIQGRKEVLSPRKRTQLQVYEDPEATPASLSPMQSPSKSKVLSDLPINAPPPTLNHLLVAEEVNSPTYHGKWAAFEASEKKLSGGSSPADSLESPYNARRLLEAAIPRIRAGTLDVHGLRKVQTIIQNHDQIMQDGCLLDHLLLTLLNAVERPSDQSKQPQILITIRRLLSKYPQQCSALYPRAICAILTARGGRSSSDRIVSGLEATAESIVAQCEPTESINAVLDLLVVEGLDPHSMFMGLYNLAGLLTKMAQLCRLPLDRSTEEGIGALIGRCLDDTNADVRRAVVELAVQFHQCVKPESRFWSYVTCAVADHRSLITYYLMRNALLQH